ncbi:prolyl oligopeptidase family protein [Geothrix sp. 21YS21S-2]|uniref:prolyl oligopeptidase family serine peptidase n=1 Tax=Geothrix sp. 21YS21S-2 TaxID=3068893 RepID=UPI00358DEEB8
MERRWLPLLLGITLMASGKTPAPTPAPEDAYLWLEDVTGEKSLDWVRAANAVTAKELEGSPAYRKLEDDLLAIMDSKEKIPYITKSGAHYYNFWKDAAHPRGLWRRTTLAEYRKAEPAWETVLDIDALGKAEKQGWVFHGAQFLRPDYRRCLVSLSPGGSDAAVVREFDVETRTFVEGGFSLPLAKSQVSWIDRDTLFVGTDFGKGSMTTSGYPRVAKIWKRGTPLAQAKLVFEGLETDMEAVAYHDPAPGFERDFLVRKPTFFTNEFFLLAKDGSRRKVDVPLDAEPSLHREWLTVKLRTSWTVGGTTYAAGSLLAAKFDDFMAGRRDFAVLFQPSATTSLEDATWTRNRLVLNVMDDVKNRLSVLTPGTWKAEPLKGAPAMGTTSVSAVDDEASDDFFMVTRDFLTPDSLYLGTLGREPGLLKSLPAFFDAGDLEVTQHFTPSKDGTRIPYFQVSRKGLKLDGANPTLLDGYGGFEVSSVPYYSGAVGRAWLSRGGVLVLANIRGGGEYGPRWHQAALKANRPRAYEDFAAVARDLAARKVTSPKHLGIMGGSNGGLLVGNMLVMYPELMGSVVCQVPLLDMKRYSHLLAGASWMEEYGDPDKPEEWAYLQTFSPYQNVKAGRKYPATFFMTTTRDDRVHPAHARKMFAKMKDMGYDVRYFENIEGGHGAGADNRQTAHFWALAYTFLDKTLR